MKKARLYSHPDFKRRVKLKAVELDLTIPEITKRLANNPNFEDLLNNVGKVDPKKKRGFNFDF